MISPPNPAARSTMVDWGVAWRALRGEPESGDLHIVAPFASGVLVGVVDGLGHGPEAAAAARIACAVLQAHAQEPVIQLIQKCHEALRKTRGVVLSIASIDASARTMSWVGVGNVQGFLIYADCAALPPRETVLTRSGVVGYQLPALKARMLPIEPGDTIIFTTDGIGNSFAGETVPDHRPSKIAEDILSRFGKDTDDALVLVARWLGV
jgi:phosphoserine phosphatase RsbX